MLTATVMNADRAAGQSPLGTAEKRDARIPAGDVVLAATLYRPAGAVGNLPAVVIVHGSAPSTRAMVGFYTSMALRMGLAVLAFDKRGTGESTGTYVPIDTDESVQRLGELAADVEHGVRWLAAQPGVDRSKIGLLGGSQAGWIMPLAASREPLVRFIVTGAGVPLSYGQEMIHEAHLQAAAGNLPAPLPWRIVSAADAQAQEYAGPHGYDPAPVLEGLQIPLLWIFGLYDTVIPTIPSINRVGELQRAGHRNHHVEILPYSNHNFENVFTRERYDLTRIIAPWLRSVGVVPAGPPAS
jgi:dienelactone hydrolase